MLYPKAGHTTSGGGTCGDIQIRVSEIGGGGECRVLPEDIPKIFFNPRLKFQMYLAIRSRLSILAFTHPLSRL
jgi:hypothetical protein